MIANHSDEIVDFEINCPCTLKECLITDSEREQENAKFENILPPTSVILVEYKI